jgi:hypothetical protein
VEILQKKDPDKSVFLSNGDKVNRKTGLPFLSKGRPVFFKRHMARGGYQVVVTTGPSQAASVIKFFPQRDVRLSQTELPSILPVTLEQGGVN